MEDFLTKILPSSGVYFSAIFPVDKPDSPPYHKAFNSIKDLATYLAYVEQTGKFNVYHACAAYKEPEYIDAVTGKKKRRTHKNCRALKSLWADIDVDPLQKKANSYRSQTEALKALRLFCEEAKIPKPMVINSGNGLHAYWPLEEEVIATNWRPYADVLKKTMIAQGMILDPTRNADMASILRTDGTTNRSSKGDKPVCMVHPAAPFNNSALFDKILRAGKQFGVTAAKEMIKSSANFGESIVDLAPTNDSPPANPHKIADTCAHMNEFRQTKGCVSEPIWYAAVGLLNYCEDGERLSHEWSSGHPGYSEEHTDQKRRQWFDSATGPATCAYFNDKSSDNKCASCSFRGKITSPIQLGAVLKEAVTQDDEGKDIVPPPFPYTRAADGIHVCIDKVAGVTKKVYPYDIYVADIVRHSAGYELAIIHYNRPHTGWVTLQAKTSIFNKKDTCWGWFSDNGIYVEHEESAAILGMYMRSYLKELHARREALKSFDSFGWKEDGSFLVGAIQIMPNGEFKHNKIVPQTIPVAKHFTQRGSMKEWMKCTEIFNNEDNLIQGFCYLVGAASPLLKFTGFGGTGINMVGPSGYGKSSIQRLINSLYGDPEKLLLKAKDSHLATIHRFGVLNNIAACIDEVGNKEGKDVSNLVLQSTQGADRLTLTQQREERQAKEWNLAIILSSNHELIPKVADMKADANAEAMRLLELKIEQSALFSDPARAAEFNNTLMNNHGIGGLFMMKHVVKDTEKFKSYVDESIRELAKTGILFEAQERFWSAGFQLAYAIGKTQTDIGMMNFDYMACIRAAYAQAINKRKALQKDKQDSFDLLAKFVNQNFDKIIAVEYGRHERPVITHDTRGGEILGRIEVVRGHKGTILKAPLSVALSDIKSFLNQRMSSIGDMRNELSKERALLSEAQMVTLGKGTHYQTPSIRCMVIDMLHPRLVSAINSDGADIIKEEELYERVGYGESFGAGFVGSGVRH